MFKSMLAVIAAAVCAGGFTAMSAPEVANTDLTALVSVNRTGKGDRLPSVLISNADLSALSSTTTSQMPPKRPPLGCDPAFSPMVDPANSHIYKRCMV